MDENILRARADGELDVFAKYILPCTTALLIVDAGDPSYVGIRNSGTGFFVDTGRSRFLVTNEHVYARFEELREAGDDIRLLLTGRGGDTTLDVTTAAVLGRDRDRDLATIDVPADQVLAKGKRYLPPNFWPPRRPSKDDPGYAYGFPGGGRSLQTDESVGLRPCLVGLRVAALMERNFLLADVNSDVLSVVPEGATPLEKYGGMSGSPVFIRPTPAEFRLAGCMCQEGESGDMIAAAYAGCIEADGSIRDA